MMQASTKTKISDKPKRFLIKPTMGFATVALLLASLTAAVANASKPGDALYGLDQATERVQLALSFTDGMKELAYRSMAAERLQEIKSLFSKEEISASHIAIAISAFEQEKQLAVELAKKNGHQAEVEQEMSDAQSVIERLFEAQQAVLEIERETLKQQAEAAMAAGDQAQAMALLAGANALDLQLNALEQKREASKQEQEKLGETVQTEKAGDNNATEQQKALQEAIKQEMEVQKEANKKLIEQQSEAAKQAAEKEAEKAEKSNRSEND